MINVVCVKWGTKYPAQFVNILYNMIKRNLSLPHTFTCFTENTDGLDSHIIARPLPDTKLYGWWQKIALFKPGFLEDNTTLYLDLDVVITNHLDEMMLWGDTDSFCGIREFARKNKMQINSSVMRFKPKQYEFIWKSFVANLADLNMYMQDPKWSKLNWNSHSTVKKTRKDGWNTIHCDETNVEPEYKKYINLRRIVDRSLKSRTTVIGDQDLIGDSVQYNNMQWFPDEWTFSFKVGREHKPPSSNAKIAIFHGHPNPNETDEEWVKQLWR